MFFYLMTAYFADIKYTPLRRRVYHILSCNVISGFFFFFFSRVKIALGTNHKDLQTRLQPYHIRGRALYAFGYVDIILYKIVISNVQTRIGTPVRIYSTCTKYTRCIIVMPTLYIYVIYTVRSNTRRTMYPNIVIICFFFSFLRSNDEKCSPLRSKICSFSRNILYTSTL